MTMAANKRIPVIVCGGATGRAVIYGYVDKLPKAETVATVYDARMVLYWPAACGGLLGLAANGAKEGLRITAHVSSVSDTWRQVLSVSPEAAKSLDGYPNV